MQALRCAAVLAAALVAAACGSGSEGSGELRGRQRVLEREVAGLRHAVARLERREPLLPPGDVAVAIDESLLQGLIAAQLPFESEVDEYQLRLEQAEVLFRGAPGVRLRGSLKRRGNLELEALVNVVGALDRISVDSGRGTLAARIVVDHIGIEKIAGAVALLSDSTLDELARLVRLQLTDTLPQVQIPVKVRQVIELPSVTSGPVRLEGASLPIAAQVSQVFAGQGRLWVAIHFDPGELARTPGPPLAQASSAPLGRERR